MDFLKNLLASVMGFFIACTIILFSIILIAFFVGQEEEIEVKTNSVLKLSLEAVVKDYAPKATDPISEILGQNEDFIGLNAIATAIENAKYDANIKGISLETKAVSAGLTQVKSIREALTSFKESGKFIFAHGDFYGQKEYYLSSVADSVFVSPLGEVEFKGLAFETLFFKDFQDKYGMKMEVIRHGKYKSAVEPYLENKMSDSNRLQLKELIDSIWDDVLTGVSEEREVTKETLNHIADNLLGRSAELAKENHLVDGVIYKDAYDAKITNLLGGKFSTISLTDYIKTGKGAKFNSSPNKIAVIYAQGEIIYGRGDENYVGQEMIIEALKKARNKESIKAVVLRVNSPGGSALASDLIWRELELTKAEKPLIVSMGDLAASGGYYIACNADKIVAEPSTITGSIGVYGIVPNISEFSENIGIHSDRVATNKGGSYSAFQPMNAAYYKVTKEGVDKVYHSFVSKVAKGRNMTFEEAHELAQGRVWTGTQALQNGLVDELGGLERAMEIAATAAGLSDYRTVNYPSYEKDFKETLKGIPFIKSEASLLKEWVGTANFQLFKKLQDLKTAMGMQARLPFVYELK
ncbi:signal peptide peptidase SppA [Flavicella sediminum]|uniref:signal peptide peptidase SppA n=1 Tax=Flavicella sediminum TaxID=2585141 RepID=UPI00111FB9B9|nr:signal peptide peptidase SppA [Flavicella sediminum]